MTDQARFVLLTVLLAATLLEFISVARIKGHAKLNVCYFLLFAFALSHLILLETSYHEKFINLLITLTFASVLADVTAFFLGNYFGHHKLPEILNKNKSWEGVLGQLIGALAGILIVNTFITPVISVWIFIPIGVGSTIGDLFNSFVKRKLNIKDWSGAIPGHGGFIDRLSSLAGSVVLTFYFLHITGLA